MQFKLLDEPMARTRTPCVASSIAVLLLGSIFGAWTPVAAQDSPFRTESVIAIDRIVVVVNDDVITDTELNARIAEVKRELRGKRIEPPSESVLRKQVLERMVLDRVQLQLADRTGVRVSNDAVDKAIRGIAERNRTNVDALYRAVRREGIDLETYREQVRQEVAIQRLIDREIANRITVSDAEVDNFLANRQRRSRTDDTYNLSHILIGVPESATPDALRVARFRANQIYQSLKQGGNFEQAAIANSQGQYALEGGTLGWKESGQLPGMFLDVLEKMEPGDISEAVRSPAG
ncbi:MAG: peptidylprolyl isomerase, partial [Woeseiaceae bacterium]